MKPCSVRPSKATKSDGNLVPFVEAGGGESEKVPEEQGTDSIGVDMDGPAGEGTNSSAEVQEARIKPSPSAPTASEVARHDVTHVPYRNWCPICVGASAKEDAHPRHGRKHTEMGLPIIDFDYDLLEEHLTILIVRDAQSGAKLAYDCEAKGPGDDWVVKQLVRDLEIWGRTDVFLQSDGEPATIALQRALAKARPGCQTLMRNSPPYNPQSNGGAEKAAQDVVDVARRLVLALEARIGVKLELTLPIVRWLIRHAAFVITRYQVGHDGHTAWRRLTGKQWNGVVAEFGEQVFGKLALHKPSTDRKVKRGKRKLAERSVKGTWIGINARTGEHVIALPSGEAIRVRTIHRVVGDARWSADAVLAVRALPRRPVPQRDDEDPSTRTVKQKASVPEAERPEVLEENRVPRELRAYRCQIAREIWVLRRMFGMPS